MHTLLVDAPPMNGGGEIMDTNFALRTTHLCVRKHTHNQGLYVHGKFEMIKMEIIRHREIQAKVHSAETSLTEIYSEICSNDLVRGNLKNST